MDGREGMALPGSSPYYLHRGGIIGGSDNINDLSIHVHGSSPSSAAQPIFRPHSNPNISGGAFISGSPFIFENPSTDFPHEFVSSAEVAVKKKRGRPKKYGPEGTNVALGLSPNPPPRKAAAEPTISGEKGRRGRPRGSGWKQKLASLGEWMNSSAGVAFSPHVLHVGPGEDIAAKILAFAQQRPRALCVMSANGSISSITLRQPSNSSSTVTYEGRFEIMCLSGSYLVSESGGPRNRTGGINISICSPDGHIVGGVIGGMVIASSPVQVIACSFVHGNNNANLKPKSESEAKGQAYNTPEQAGKNGQNVIFASPNSGTNDWPMISHTDVRNPHADIDLTRG